MEVDYLDCDFYSYKEQIDKKNNVKVIHCCLHKKSKTKRCNCERDCYLLNPSTKRKNHESPNINKDSIYSCYV